MRARQSTPRTLLGVLIAVTAGACGGEPTGPAPTPDFDASATAQTVAEVTSVPTKSEAVFAQLGLAAGALSGAGAAASVQLAVPISELSELTSASVPGLPELALYLAARAGSVPIFPSNLLGKTFVWDPEVGQYVIDEGLSGAPPNGVRFILYAINPLTGKPALPLQPVGFADLIDQSDAAATRLRVTAVDTSSGSAVTVVDYLLQGSFELTSGVTIRLSAGGFLSDGTERLDFTLTQDFITGESPGTVRIVLAHNLSVAGQDASIDLQLDGVAIEGKEDLQSLDATLTIRDGTNSAVLQVSTSQGALTGTLRYNGQTVVVLGGTVDAPTFTGPGGEPLQAGDLSALGEIFDAIDGILNFGTELLQPMAELFGIMG